MTWRHPKSILLLWNRTADKIPEERANNIAVCWFRIEIKSLTHQEYLSSHFVFRCPVFLTMHVRFLLPGMPCSLLHWSWCRWFGHGISRHFQGHSSCQKLNITKIWIKIWKLFGSMTEFLGPVANVTDTVNYPKLYLPTKFHPNRTKIAKVSYSGWFWGGWGGWLGWVKRTRSQIICWYTVTYPKLHLPSKFHPNWTKISKVSYSGWFWGGWCGLNKGLTLYVFFFSCIPPKVTSMQS